MSKKWPCLDDAKIQYLCKTFWPSVIRKFFPLDKNYLLETAQLSLQDHLLTGLIHRVSKAFEQLHNPLMLEDSYFHNIRTYQPGNLKPLYGFYQNFAGIYRYKYADNQLSFLWDGSDHLEQYKREWTGAFIEWTDRFIQNELFQKAVLDLSVFLPQNRHAHLAESRMNHFIFSNFEIRIHKSRGIVKMKVA